MSFRVKGKNARSGLLLKFCDQFCHGVPKPSGSPAAAASIRDCSLAAPAPPWRPRIPPSVSRPAEALAPLRKLRRDNVPSLTTGILAAPLCSIYGRLTEARGSMKARSPGRLGDGQPARLRDEHDRLHVGVSGSVRRDA